MRQRPSRSARSFNSSELTLAFPRWSASFTNVAGSTSPGPRSEASRTRAGHLKRRRYGDYSPTLPMLARSNIEARCMTAITHRLSRLRYGMKSTVRRWINKSWTSKRGISHTGRRFKKASLRRLLTNAAYAGKAEYRGTMYDGDHSPIIDLASIGSV